ncbi:retinol dehydrogenase 7-like isoform X1 [Bufo gargarizans]|uniref:retinol dehydrogenase 7-like isoform X1 n=2 Tax=Bufo gargarizans TaxID=30331 RepID=UPI001CF23EDE|nr:retinol dehydrogenase 7-like isoform X1 [Bufo gargarizans]
MDSLETEGQNYLLIMWLLLLAVFGLILLYRWYRQSLILENLTDKYVFITGCDTGFGNLLAKQLDNRGMKVLAACLTDHGAENLKKETSSRLQTVILDVTNSESISAAAEIVSTTVGNAGLWGLVNNAGAFGPAPNEWQKKEDFVRVVNVNLIGTVDVTLHLLPLVRKAQGRIVNISSCLGRLSFIGGGYCMSKYGVEAFSDGLRRELCEFGVKVSIIEPGAFGTMMTLSIDNHVNNLKRLWENLPQGIKDSYGEQYYEQYEKALRGLVGTASPKIYEVTNSMEHALTAVYPWTRYSPGLDSKLFYLPMSYLPTVLSDYVLCHSAPKPVAKKWGERPAQPNVTLQNGL